MPQAVIDLIVGEKTAILTLIEQAAEFVFPFGRFAPGYAGHSHSHHSPFFACKPWSRRAYIRVWHTFSRTIGTCMKRKLRYGTFALRRDSTALRVCRVGLSD